MYMQLIHCVLSNTGALKPRLVIMSSLSDDVPKSEKTLSHLYETLNDLLRIFSPVYSDRSCQHSSALGDEDEFPNGFKNI